MYAPENFLVQPAPAVRAHHDQIRREFAFVFDNAARDICACRLVDMRLHRDIRRKSTLANFIEVGGGFVTRLQVARAVDCGGRIAFDDVQRVQGDELCSFDARAFTRAQPDLHGSAVGNGEQVEAHFRVVLPSVEEEQALPGRVSGAR